MNYKVVLGFIGAAAIVVGVICFVKKNKTNKGANGNSDYKDDVKETPSIIRHTETYESDDTAELNKVKADAAKKIGERHEEAENMIKESVENIFGDAGAGETKNETIKKQMFEDLDNI